MVDHGIVEPADVEAWTKRRPGPLAQREDAQFTDLVGGRLSWHHQIAVDLGFRKALLQLGVSDQVVDRPGSRPAEAVQSGIHYQPTGPVGFGAQASEARIRVGIKAKVLSKPLRVESPAFAVTRVPVVAADLGQRLDLHGARRLLVTAGARLLPTQRVHRPARPRGEILHVVLEA